MTGKTSLTIHWAVWGLILGAPVIIAMLIWQLAPLNDPVRWCSVTIGIAKVAAQKPLIEDCTTIVLKLLELKDHAIVGLLLAVVIGYLVMVSMVLGAKVSWTLPGGAGGSIGRDGPIPFEGEVTGTIGPEPAPQQQEGA